MLNTPILLIIFNRPNTTRIVFDRLREVAPKHLFIAADGPRTNKVGEDKLCTNTRNLVLNGIDWDCQVRTLFRDENLGCGKAVSGAINWFFSQVEMGIIIEDDIVPDTSFFPFCEELLLKYRYDNDIISIGGFNFDYFNNQNSYVYSRFMSMWGWATWRRAAIHIDYGITNWKSKKRKKFFLNKVLKKSILDVDFDWIDYWFHIFDSTSKGLIDTWDYQWMFHQLNNRMLSIYPSVNLVKNIGFGKDATHTIDKENPIANIREHKIEFPLIHPLKKDIDFHFEDKYLKEIWCSHKSRTNFKIFKNYILRLCYKLKSDFASTTSQKTVP